MIFQPTDLRHCTICLVAMSMSLFASCSVDKEYDLTGKDIDMTVNVGKGVEIPVGDFKMIPIESMVADPVRKFFKDEGDVFLVDWPSSLQVPVQFGTYDVHGIGNADTGNIRVKAVEFAMDVVNTIPFRFTCQAEAIDVEGNVVDNVDVDMSVTIDAGDIDKPSSTPALMKVTLADEVVNFDGFRINFIISEIPASGSIVSKKQGVQIINSSLRFPDGITIKDTDE